MAPSCSAATGGTRVARSAGASAATSADADADDERDDDSARRERDARGGDVGADRLEQRVDAFGYAESRGDADERRDRGRAARPRRCTSASTWRRVAPSERSMANSRIRWATVIEKALKMMNAPTITATPPKASRMVQHRADRVADRLGVIGHALRRGLDVGIVRQRLLEAPRQRVGRDTRLRRHRDARVAARQVVPALRIGQGRRHHRRAADRRRVTEVEDAGDVTCCTPCSVARPMVSAHMQVLVGGELGVDADRAVAVAARRRRRRSG